MSTEQVTAEQDPRSTRVGSRVTHRGFWIVLLIVTTGLTLGRAPGIYRQLPSQIPPEMLSTIGDPSLMAWSLKIATALAVMVSLFCVGIFAMLASGMERRIFPAKLATWRGHGVGVFFLCVLFAVVPPQVYAAVTGAVRPEKGLLFYVYMVAVAVLTPLLFWKTVSRLPARRILVVYGCASLLVFGLSIG